MEAELLSTNLQSCFKGSDSKQTILLQSFCSRNIMFIIDTTLKEKNKTKTLNELKSWN